MSDTLRNQLLGLGFKAAPKPEQHRNGKPPRRDDGRDTESTARKQAAGRPRAGGNGQAPKARHGKPQAQQDIDLAKAYAIRAQREKDERMAAERAKQEEARQRREAKAKLAELLQGKALNDAGAEIARHFEYGGKIKRIHVTPDQLKGLNAGELGVAQLDGRYLLLTAALLAEAEAIFAPAIALKVDPETSAVDDPYADPHYQVPDDLVW